MARRIYIVELEIEADDETQLPGDESLEDDIRVAVRDRGARLGRWWEPEVVTVVGKREG